MNPDYADTFRKLEGDAADRGQTDFKGGLPGPSPAPRRKSAPPTP